MRCRILRALAEFRLFSSLMRSGDRLSLGGAARAERIRFGELRAAHDSGNDAGLLRDPTQLRGFV